jgi:hypothetical protein
MLHIFHRNASLPGWQCQLLKFSSYGFLTTLSPYGFSLLWGEPLLLALSLCGDIVLSPVGSLHLPKVMCNQPIYFPSDPLLQSLPHPAASLPIAPPALLSEKALFLRGVSGFDLLSSTYILLLLFCFTRGIAEKIQEHTCGCYSSSVAQCTVWLDSPPEAI